ncbi:MAG: M20/M25/M40 family metallo-hydrolase [Pyrinomonadaceae bacterium]
MVSVHVSERVGAAEREGGPGPLTSLLVFLLFAATALLAIYLQLPPSAVPADAPPSEFSSARALKHIEAFARRPHPIGSAESAAVREYVTGQLRALGLDTQVQTAAVGAEYGPPYVAATVRNVVARLKGAGGGGGKAVMLAAHYDSVPAGPGASDDGVGVATLLETARALGAGPPPAGDVIFLFTEGEEAGLLGARAFVGQHPWAKDVGVALNFEARGNEGPVIMFETSEANHRLIDEFAADAPHPLANSLSYEIYRRMPNDTDLTVFKRGDMPGMNFAQIGGLTHYHTPADDVQSVSERSLQHHGSYALSLSRGFASHGAEGRARANAVYFNLLGPVFVHYDAGYALPLAALAALLYACVLILGFRRGRLTSKGIAFGAGALVAACVASALTVTVAWRLARPLHRGFDSTPWGDPYDGGFYVVALVLLTLAVVAALYNWFRRRSSLENLTAGALLCWVALAVAAGVLAPGASYLFMWPLLFALAGVAFTSLRSGRESASKWVVLTLTVLPAAALFTPLVMQVFEALTLNAAGVVAVLLALLCGLLVPHLSLLAGRRPWVFPAAAASISVALIAGGLAAAAAAGGAKTDSAFYLMSADTGEALWVSQDRAPDEWTAQFFPTGVRRGLGEFLPLSEGDTFLTGAAGRTTLPAPEVSVVEDASDGAQRTLRLRIRSLREAPLVSVYVKAEGELSGVLLGGSEAPGRLTRGGFWAARYYAPPEEGVELTLRLKGPGRVRVRVNDVSYGLPESIPVKPRPANIRPAPADINGATVVTKVFDL